VIRALGLGNDELATDELERLALERSEIDQPVVLDSLPAPYRERGWLMPRLYATAARRINVSE